MTPTQREAIKGMLAYFDSGNNIPVDKAVIKANCAEVAALRAALAEPAPDQKTIGWIDDDARLGWAMWRIKDLEQQLGSRPAPQAQQPAPPADVPMLTDEELREAFAQNLGGTYVCTRVWSAWSYGAMSEDDFYPASESDDLLDSLVLVVRQKAGPT